MDINSAGSVAVASVSGESTFSLEVPIDGDYELFAKTAAGLGDRVRVAVRRGGSPIVALVGYEPSVIAGTVVFEQGVPAAGAEVIATPEDGSVLIQYTSTNELGEFRIDGVRAGVSYAVRADAHGYSATAQSVYSGTRDLHLVIER